MRLPLILAGAVTLVPALSSTGALQRPSEGSAAHEDGIAGVYDCRGVTADGAAYQGVVQIVRHHGVYQVIWMLSPEEQHLGIGIVTGDVLSVSYFGGLPGVVAYRIEQGDQGLRLTGQWTVANADGRVFVETLTRRGAVPAQPVTPEPPRPSRRVPPMLLRAA